MPSSAGRYYWILLAAIFLLSLVIRAGITARFQGLSSPPNASANPDALEYELIAYNLANGDGYGFRPGVPTASRPPGIPLALVVPYLLTGRSFLAAHWWIILISSATCLVVAWLGTLCGGRCLGLVAAGWLALYPGHFYYSMHFLSEPVYGFWLALACGLSIWAFRRHRYGGDAAAGVAWAFAILTRVEMIMVIPIAWVLLTAVSRQARRPVYRHAAVQTAVALAIVSLWAGRNFVSMGAPSLSTQRGYAFWGSHNRLTMSDPRYIGSWVTVVEMDRATHPLTGADVERDRQAFEYGVATVRENLSRMPFVTVMKIWRFASPFFETPNRAALLALALGWIVTAPFVVYGLWVAFAGGAQDRLLWSVPLAPMLATVGMSAIFYGSHRFRDALAPLFVLFAAYGALRLTERLTGRHPC